MLSYIIGAAAVIVGLVFATRRKVRNSPMARPSKEPDCEVLIVGSGILGSTLAAVLGRDGRKVTVIERSLSTPNRIIGEVLQAGGIKALRELGLEDCLKGIDGQCINEIIITDKIHGLKVHMPYPNGAEAIGFCHGKFVDALREKAQAEENCTYIEGNVLDVIKEDGIVRGVKYRSKGSDEDEIQELHANLTMICDGTFSRLRKSNVSVNPEKLGVTLAFEHEGNLKVNNGTYLEMFLTPDNSLHTYRITPNVNRFYINVRGPMPKDLNEYYRKHCQNLSDGIRDDVLATIDKSTIRSIPTFHLTEAATLQPGILTLGDALSIRHPVTAAGMTVIMKDTVILRELLKNIPDLGDVEAVQKAQETLMSRRKSYTFVINVFARSFYNIAFPPNDPWVFLRSAAIGYMTLSEKITKDFVLLMTNIETRPMVLMYHMTAMTLYSAYQAIKQERWWRMPRGVLRALTNTCHIAAMAAPVMWAEA